MSAVRTPRGTRPVPKLHVVQTFGRNDRPRLRLRCTANSARRPVAERPGEGHSTMSELFDDELSDADLDRLEALGAAEDADLILGPAGEEDDA